MTITKIAIRRPVTVSMFVVAVILFGTISLQRLALNLLPDISYPSITIQTDYEDAAPEEIENLITRPIEEAVGVVSGLTRLSSISRPGQSEVVLEFGWDTSMDVASMDAREKLDLIDLPEDSDKPIILRFDPSHDPIMRLQLHGDLNLTRLRYLADQDIKKRLESTDGVAAVKVVGGREEQIRIEIDEKRLAELNIPITEVTNILRQGNLNQAGGSLYDLDANYLVRMLNEFRSVEEIRTMVLRDREGRAIALEDVAKVWRGTKDRQIIARLNGNESVELAVYKEGDANTVTVSAAVHRRLEALPEDKTIPKGIEYQVVFDQANFISQSVNNVLSAAVIGGVLATIILFLFLRHLRSTIIIAISIPISIMATFAVMYQTGITLNIMSLGGVALGVGMLVDNSIVVLESVHRHHGRQKNLWQAVYDGTREVGMAVTASTLTTVAVFVPLVFVEGVAGQLFRDQALTITYSLLASLAVALTVIPMVLALRFEPTADEDEPQPGLASAPRAPEAPPQEPNSWTGALIAIRAFVRFLFFDMVRIVLSDLRRLFRAAGNAILKVLEPAVLAPFESWFNKLTDAYPALLIRSLDNKPLVLAVAAGLVGLSALGYKTLGAELIPPLTQGEFSFDIELTEGAPIEQTDRVLKDLEGRVAELPGVATVFASVGGSNKNQFARQAIEENAGQLHVVMEDRRDRLVEQQTIDRVRQELDRYPEIRFTFSRPTLFSFKTPIEVEIYSFDLESQSQASDLVMDRLRRIEGLHDITTTTELGNPEIQIRFDRERLARLGLNETRISEVLRNKIRGDVASRYRDNDKQIDILVRAQESQRNNIADLRNLLIVRGQDANQFQGGNNRRRNGQQQGQDGAGAEGQSIGEITPPGNQAAGFPQSGADASRVPIRLGAVADIAFARGPAEIHRIRGQRAAVVSANLSGRDLGGVATEIREELQQLRAQLPVNTSLGLGGQNEELETSYQSIRFAISLAIFLVYLVMASQFESLIHPLIILFTVPLAMVGVILSLVVTRTDISVMVLLGAIILVGIVVNNAIVLVDYTNRLRRAGMSKRDALVRAGQVRFRPILMTTLTTVLGLIPLAVGWGEGSEVRAPMAITVMGGLLFSTLLTLIFIPVAYELVDRKAFLPAGDQEEEFDAAPEGGGSSDLEFENA
jgi:HAE1 family hydrophobic/amphiphilic exporter-1